MRPFLLAVLIVFASLAQVSAQNAPTMPPSTYPDAGSFCGLFKPCSKAATQKQGY
ncbi:hypothetical protein [Tateyamaria sp. SN3-11]|uniref:hypothetical protein n=1 Tax=Tateyamaria sp. SN3-11 TaxID=3092147 RepID=UPI0039E9A0A9